MSPSSSAARKLTPEMLRELRRHIQPSSSPRVAKPGGGGSSINNGNTNSNKTVFYGCVAFTSFAASIPLIAYWWMGGLVEKDAGLTSAQNRRGAFLNSGSRDVGRDENWDFGKGVYTGQRYSGYAAMAEDEKNKRRQQLPDQFMALPANDKDPNAQQQQQAKLEAFAKGKIKMDGRPTDY